MSNIRATKIKLGASLKQQFDSNVWLGSRAGGVGSKGFIKPPKQKREGWRGGMNNIGTIIPPAYNNF